MAEHQFGFRTRALHAGGTPDAEHGARPGTQIHPVQSGVLAVPLHQPLGFDPIVTQLNLLAFIAVFRGAVSWGIPSNADRGAGGSCR